jgi:hypothetical protein
MILILKTLTDIFTMEKHTLKMLTIEQHVLDTNAGKTTVLSRHRCLINPGVKK